MRFYIGSRQIPLSTLIHTSSINQYDPELITDYDPIEDFLAGTLSDISCYRCHKRLHYDPADELEGDETWVSTDFKKVFCVDCYDKLPSPKKRGKGKGKDTQVSRV